ncbi:MAG: haloacid dehalogenase-like hydrolase, partial [Sedimenticolaceae bacterium]
MMNRALLAILPLGFAVVFTACAAVQPTDPLPSWNEGETKTAITNFVTNVTTEGSPDFVPSAQRIAAFDNDG